MTETELIYSIVGLTEADRRRQRDKMEPESSTVGRVGRSFQVTFDTDKLCHVFESFALTVSRNHFKYVCVCDLKIQLSVSL